MKIRSGFVSNSSTSSFVCMTTKETSEKAEATLTEEQCKTLTDLLYSYSLGDMKFIGYESSSSDAASYIGQYGAEDVSDEEWDKYCEAADAWKDAVKKVGGENPIIEVAIDM